MTFQEKYDSLTERQREIYHLIVTDHMHKEIASRLNITEKTVKYHASNIYKKFGVRGKSKLIVASYEPRYEESPLGKSQLPLGDTRVFDLWEEQAMERWENYNGK